MSIIDDTLPIFPACPTFGFTMQPDYLVKIVAREGGFERRDLKWSLPLHRYATVPLGDQDQVDIETVIAFWHAVGGRATAFRFKDWADYTSGSLGETQAPVITPLDQPFTFIATSPGGYQLTKLYKAGSLTRVRYIYKPVGSTIRVVNTSGSEQSSAYWSIDEASGLLVPLSGFSGTPGAWGGQFYVQVRFDSDLVVTLSNHLVQNISFVLQEVRFQP